MSRLTKNESVMLFRPRKRLGFSQLVGTMFMGYIRCGEYNEYAGIYQYCNAWEQRYHVKTLMHWPKNPQTGPQQAWRAVFTAGAVDWGSLTSDEKLAYNKRAKPYHMTGYHLHQREWLGSH